ncbi:hypothetical protein M5X00_29250 [Paenibacillus alvei]|uniref:hypothetical protein n=1 Tax=Paenibacillus alvei TaxID=44250 RepID=UPI00227EBCF4|nr:hypothetical protein [Paenibacillus alvei]MCY9732154.1 hypothetical protein [Paenibacillus alvei]MCY9758306.1 hypothetical protein [Paenibacillus alvei]
MKRKIRIWDYIVVFVVSVVIGAINIIKTDDFFGILTKVLVISLIVSFVVGTITNLIFKPRKTN